jgi:UDP-N-acetylglucosamine:LPS N-acetylglucosamine transferase
MGKKILLPYLSAGLGHGILAQAIAHEVRCRRPDWDLRLMDAARELDDELLRKTFVDMWRVVLRMPLFLSRVLYGLERMAPRVSRALNRRSFRTAVPKAAAFLDEYEPDLVMSTHWACSHLFSLARGRNRFPLYYVYGELGRANNIIECGADLYFTLTPRSFQSLVNIGVDRARIRPVPLIVDSRMVKSDVPRDVLRRGLGIPTRNLVVVLSLGGEGIGRTLPFIDAFAQTVTGASLVVLTGRNDELLHEVQKRTDGGAVIALGYQEDISGIMGAADVLAGKCGTSFAMVAMVTGIPLIVTHLGAPPEQENMRYVVDHGFGWYCPRPRLFAQRVSRLVERPAAERAGTRAAATAGNGAEVIAQSIVDALA